MIFASNVDHLFPSVHEPPWISKHGQLRRAKRRQQRTERHAKWRQIEAERRRRRREGRAAPCLYCRQILAPAARRCQHCATYQGFFRRNLHNWQLAGAIAFAIVFISVHSIDVARVTFRKPINFAVAWINAVDAYDLRVAAKNIGRKHAVVYQRALLSIGYSESEKVASFLVNLNPWMRHDAVLHVDEISGFHISVPHSALQPWKEITGDAIESGRSLKCSVTIWARDMTNRDERPSSHDGDGHPDMFELFESESTNCPDPNPLEDVP